MGKFASLVVAALLLAAAPARADWLERAWDEQAIAETGAPAITLGLDGIRVVLPEATLAAAHAAGVSTAEAVQLFVQRYGHHCSDVLDLDHAHRGLRVQVSLLKPVALEDASERVQGEVLATLKANSKQKRFPRVEQLFVTADESEEVTIDYVPERQAHCVPDRAEVS
jgi:hypothetical protein